MPDAVRTRRICLNKDRVVRVRVARGAKFLCVRTIPRQEATIAGDIDMIWDSPECPVLYITEPLHEKEYEFRTLHIVPHDTVSMPIPLTYVGTFSVFTSLTDYPDIPGGLAFHLFEAPDDQRPLAVTSPNSSPP